MDCNTGILSSKTHTYAILCNMTIGREGEPQQVVPSVLAVVFSERAYKEFVYVNQRLRLLHGEEELPVDSEHDARQIGKHAVIIEKILRSRGHKKVIGAIYLGAAYANATTRIGSQYELSERTNGDYTRMQQLAREDGENVVDSLLSGGITHSTECTLKVLEGAEELAQERKVPVTKIFEEDSLYFDLVRKVYTPATLAFENISLANRMTYETGEKIVLGHIRNSYLAAKAPDIPPEVLDEMVNQRFETIKQQKETQDLIKEIVGSFKRDYYLLAGEQVERYFGTNGIDQLPDQMRKGIQFYREGLQHTHLS